LTWGDGGVGRGRVRFGAGRAAGGQRCHRAFFALYELPARDLAASIERAYAMVNVQTVSTGFVTFNPYGGTDGKSTLRSPPVGSLQFEVQGLAAPAK